VVGSGLPTTLPSRGWLTADISVEVVLNVVALVVWAVWAHFVACLLVELRAARSGTGLPGAVPFGGGSQHLARKLVAAALLLAGTASLAPATGAAPARAPGISAAAEDAWGSRYQAQAMAIAQQQAAAEQAASEQAATSASVAPAAEIYYTVQPPNGRNHDTLWDIAERTLGDPLRYKELYQLNHERVQPDGRTLVDADLIYPGWVMRMPADATGPGLTVVEPRVPVEQGAPATPAAPAAPVTPTAPAERAPASPAVAEQATGTADVQAAAQQGRDLDRMLLGGGLLLAGVLVALTGRRGPYGEPGEGEQRVRLAADGDLAGLVDRALRSLAASRVADGLPLPEVALVFASRGQVVLHLTGPSEHEPPAPWTVAESGRSWQVAGDDVPSDVASAPAPYPALVNAASTAGYEILVDLEASPGLVALGGDLVAAREAAASMAVELATNAWSDGVDVTLVGFSDDLTGVAPEHLSQVPSLDDLLPELERSSAAHRAMLATLGVDGVLSGRLARGRGGPIRPRVLLLAAVPTTDQAGRLQQLVGSGRTPLAVVAVGDLPTARWRFVLDAADRIDLGVLGVHGQARRLAPAGYAELATLVQEADERRVAATTVVAALSPRGAVQETTGEDDPGAPSAAVQPATALLDLDQPVAVHVALLGPVTVQAPGPVDDQRRPLLTEVVVAASLHPEGLHDAVLRSALWPRGVSDDVVQATVRDVQAWLGRTPQGAERLHLGDDGRWHLSVDVRSDHAELAARAARAGGALERDDLTTGLSLVRGEAFAVPVPGRYGWLAFHRGARDARVLGTAVARRVAVLAVADGRPDQAEHALRQGLALVPTSEVLWRDLLRLLGDDDPTLASGVADEMYARLSEHRVSITEPETDALVGQLAPGYRHRTA